MKLWKSIGHGMYSQGVALVAAHDLAEALRLAQADSTWSPRIRYLEAEELDGCEITETVPHVVFIEEHGE